MIQSVLFDTKKWNVTKAKAWLKHHNLKYNKVDKKPNHLRFRQVAPDKRYKYFTKKLKHGVELIIIF